jgi:bacteriophage exclusion system BrxA-like protein
MNAGSRANVASSFTLIKGSMLEETYAVLASWDLGQSKRENLLRDVTKVINRRFDPAGRDRPLTLLAAHGCDFDVWRPILLWHITRDEFLLRDFLLNWLFPAYEAGALQLRTEDLHDYLRTIQNLGGVTEHPWTEATLKRVATALLRLAVDFGLLRGGQAKEFASYHLPEKSFLYLLHAILEEVGNAGRVITASDWRMFLMHSSDVERELLRLHQFRKLEYQVAGSLVQLTLPCATAREYAEKLVA